MFLWQKYALDCFKQQEFVELPPEIRALQGMWRFGSYKEFEQDTLYRGGCVAAATLSMLFKPKVVVEFGVQVGWTSLLLCRLNPEAKVFGVDIEKTVKKSLGHDFQTGHIPIIHKVPNFTMIIGNSWEFSMPGKVNLCFIDGDHFLPAVEKDTWRAWNNRNTEEDWCIAWDDYHPNNPDVYNTINKFCKEVGYELQKIASWYWIGTKTISEADLIGSNIW